MRCFAFSLTGLIIVRAPDAKPSANVLDSPTELLALASSGEGRLIAAAVLYVLFWALQKVPFVISWLGTDSGWLTAKRKKLATNLLLSFAPVIPVLADSSKTLQEVGVTALTIALSAAGLNSMLKSATKKPAPSSGS